MDEAVPRDPSGQHFNWKKSIVCDRAFSSRCDGCLDRNKWDWRKHYQIQKAHSSNRNEIGPQSDRSRVAIHPQPKPCRNCVSELCYDRGLSRGYPWLHMSEFCRSYSTAMWVHRLNGQTRVLGIRDWVTITTNVDYINCKTQNEQMCMVFDILWLDNYKRKKRD